MLLSRWRESCQGSVSERARFARAPALPLERLGSDTPSSNLSFPLGRLRKILANALVELPLFDFCFISFHDVSVWDRFPILDDHNHNPSSKGSRLCQSLCQPVSL